MAAPLTALLQIAFEEHWAADHSRSIGRRQMKEAIWKIDASRSEADLDVFFDAADLNKNGTIEYEEFIELVFSTDQVADLAMQELGLLQQAVKGTSRSSTHGLTDNAEMDNILEESKREAIEDARRNMEKQQKENETSMQQALLASGILAAAAAEKQKKEEEDVIQQAFLASREAATAAALKRKQEEDETIQQALEASAAAESAEAARKLEAKRKEEEEEQRFLRATLKEAEAEAARRAKAQADADEAELEAALKASEEAIAEDRERIRKKHEKEDGSDLFKAALRASCLDLGPRGISQAAKVFATGDATIGQPRAGFDTSTSGARGRRGKATVGAVAAYTGAELAPVSPVAAHENSPGARRRQAEMASRTSGPNAFKRPGSRQGSPAKK
eukprot:TRINITY_DN16160_c0_g1_i1.p1 TRINITY_DN16160_c0_g1~~TRINITY_DN16160_c0_g1_i1.p1  ORF type:complete len:428 (+),score=112.70 TRINITY_DN16160_c0_g1_i1:117-1286(+)